MKLRMQIVIMLLLALLIHKRVKLEYDNVYDRNLVTVVAEEVVNI